jgi:hypothetical protein
LTASSTFSNVQSSMATFTPRGTNPSTPIFGAAASVATPNGVSSVRSFTVSPSLL